jgi:citrate lyase subunit beta/citryl-CoA lyase
MSSVRPIRSLLFIPGDRAHWMPKADRAGADAVVFDLEGSLSHASKESGRREVREVLDRADEFRAAILVRINDVRSPEWTADLDVIVGAGLLAVMLPQVAGVDDVKRLDEALSRIESDRGLPEGSVLIDPLMETPMALLTAYEIAISTDRIAYMGAGISRNGDIARTMGYRWSEEGTETLHFRSKVLLDVRAAGVENPLSGMWGDVADLDGLRRLAHQTAGLGYEGMMVIHPTHVPVVNEIFSPSAGEIAEWQETLRVMEAATEEGRGVTTIAGQVVDEAHVLTARQQLRRAARWGLFSGPK